MSRTSRKSREWDRLRGLLSATDPVDRDPDLSPAAAERIRREMHRAATPQVRARWTVVALAASSLVAAIILAGWFYEKTNPRVAPTPGERSDARAELPRAPQRIRLEYTTRENIRVVWTFDPDFRLE